LIPVVLKRAIALALFLGACVLTLHGQDTREFSRMDLLNDTYAITINDRLVYQVIEEQSPPVVLVLDKDGKVRFPPLNQSIPVLGRTCFQVAQELKSLLEVDFFYRATVDIKVAESNFREKVTVYGQVRNQGIVNLPQDGFMTITQVINQMGGFMDGADLENITIQRKDPENPEKDNQIIVNVAEIFNQGRVENDVRVFGDDVIIVNRLDEMGGRYSVLGAVKSPGLFTITQNRLTVSEAILLAGGFTEVARDSRVRLTRRIPDSNESETFWINVRRILQEGDRNEDMLVKENDIINVAERIIVF
jgi:protein involved in polysaccharide export with SLBB domain